MSQEAEVQSEETTSEKTERRFASVELKEIGQSFPQPDGSTLNVVENVSLRFARPAINMVLGPSGCGKSTILKMMGGVRPIGIQCPTAGQILIDGEPVEGPHPDAVMVFQRYANRPDLTIRENVAFPFRLKLWKNSLSEKERDARVDHILDAVGLADKADLRPSQLSGGQNQRVALARALVLRPKILLMDEPFGALDAQTREEMQELLVRLWSEQPCLVLFVTHDVTEALALGDRIILLSTGPARVVDDFTIDEPKLRTNKWLDGAEGEKLKARILNTLHARGRGQVRVSV